MKKIEWVVVGYLVLFIAVLTRDELSWLFTGLFLLSVAALSAVFMYLITNE